jgi:polygalacturonase
MNHNRRDFVKVMVGGVALVTTGGVGAACSPAPKSPAGSASPWDQVPAILARIVPPTFPERDFDITSYGAVGDGLTNCDDAIKQAIEACAAADGGRVVVPPGRFATGPIHLESNVNLHVSDGATLAFSTDPNRYLPAVLTRWGGMECLNYSPCIYALEKTHVAVTGKGTLDGQAANENWWRWKGLEKFGAVPGTPNEVHTVARLKDMVEKAVPVEKRVFGNGDTMRPMMLQLYRCADVLIEGVTFIRSPMWVVHPVLCKNVTVRGVTVDSHGPNNDGCNPESCTDVLIEDCTFHTGDDCVAIKSGRNRDGRRIATPTANVVIRNCRMKDGHGAVTVGSECSGGVHHIFFERCTLEGPNLWWALAFRNTAERGGTVEHVYCRDLTVTAARVAALGVDFQYDEGAAGPYHPTLRNVEVTNMKSTGAKRVMELLGIPKGTIKDVNVSNCVFVDVGMSSVIENTTGVKLTEVRVNGIPIATLSELMS